MYFIILVLQMSMFLQTVGDWSCFHNLSYVQCLSILNNTKNKTLMFLTERNKNKQIKKNTDKLSFSL